ncbi:MAG: helix-turn-helix domain-containing protein [Oscillospiraceae bacterium]|nr:helix-turn-helix domain-containing protein [Oscillospiraceae bacterium]
MIGAKLKELRTKNRFTIAQLCDELQMNQNTYAKYERDERDVSTETLSKLADFYHVTTDYLLGREPAPDPFGEVSLSPEDEQEVLAKYLSLPDDVRAVILDVLVQLADAARARRAQEMPRPLIMTIRKHVNKAAAGAGYDLSDHDQWERVKVLQTDEAEHADFAVEVDGDSMLPEYHDGDLVLIVLAEDVPVGEVGLFRQNGKGFIKQKGEKYLISINPDYPNIYPEDGEITCVGRVIGIAELPE